jgi:RHS repeat-associated protein
MTVNTSGTVIGKDDYYPFGMQMDSRCSASSADPRYKFTGQERDAETGYDDFGARYYDARLGRFLTVDPQSGAGRLRGWSPYHYAYDNPERFNDPTGSVPGGPDEQIEIPKENERRQKGNDLEAQKNRAESSRSQSPDNSLIVGLNNLISSVKGVFSGGSQTGSGKDAAQSSAESASEASGLIKSGAKAGGLLVSSKTANVADAMGTSSDMVSHIALITPGAQEFVPILGAVGTVADINKGTAQLANVALGGSEYTYGDVAQTFTEIATNRAIERVVPGKKEAQLVQDLVKAATHMSGD